MRGAQERKKALEPLARDGPQEPADVVPLRARHGMYGVACHAGQSVAIHSVIELGVPDCRLDRLAPLEPALLLLGEGLSLGRYSR